jgi:hypothetical protein
MKIRFLVNDLGDVGSISIPIEPAVSDLTFTRKLPQLTDDLFAALIGEYQTPVEGIAISITAHNGKVYAAQTGSAAEEIKLYRLDAGLIGFMMKRNRLDFVRKDGRITHLVLKTPDITLEAPKVV